MSREKNWSYPSTGYSFLGVSSEGETLLVCTGPQGVAESSLSRVFNKDRSFPNRPQIKRAYMRETLHEIVLANLSESHL